MQAERILWLLQGEWKLSESHASFGNRNYCALIQFLPAPFNNQQQKLREFAGTQTFHADSNHRRSHSPSKRQQPVKICVQRDDNLSMLSGVFQQSRIARRGEPKLTDVGRFNPCFGQIIGRGTG